MVIIYIILFLFMLFLIAPLRISASGHYHSDTADLQMQIQLYRSFIKIGYHHNGSKRYLNLFGKSFSLKSRTASVKSESPIKESKRKKRRIQYDKIPLILSSIKRILSSVLIDKATVRAELGLLNPALTGMFYSVFALLNQLKEPVEINIKPNFLEKKCVVFCEISIKFQWIHILHSIWLDRKIWKPVLIQSR